MSNVVGVVLMLLAVLVFVLCLIGLISPKWLHFSKTGIPPKRSHIALGLLFAPTILLGLGGALLDPVEEKNTTHADAAPAAPASPPAATPEQNSTPSVATLGVTPEEFRKSYNAQIGQLEKSWRVAEFDISEGPVRDTFTAKLGSASSMVGSVDKTSKKLVSVMVISSSGQTADNMQSIAILLSTAHALTQGASKEEISNAVSALVTTAFDGMDKADTPMASRIVGNRKFSAMASQLTGLMFTVGSPD